MTIRYMKSTGLYLATGKIDGVGYYATGYTRTGVIDRIIKLANAQ